MNELPDAERVGKGQSSYQKGNRRMIVLDCEQGSLEWHKARAGIPTASAFPKVFTGGGKKSEQAGKYINELCAEWLIGGSFGGYVSAAMEQGKQTEEEARHYYELITDVEVAQVGFCYADEERQYGSSPDGFVGDDGGVEIKVVAPHVQVEYIRKGKVPTGYIPQVQGNMLVTGRKWWDFFSYCPPPEGLPMPPHFLIRVPRDEQYIMAQRAAIHAFLGQLKKAQDELRALGYSPAGESK